MIGPENLNRFLNQSDLKLKPMLLYFEFSLATCDFVLCFDLLLWYNTQSKTALLRDLQEQFYNLLLYLWAFINA